MPPNAHAFSSDDAMPHDIRWYTPAPFWPKRLQNGSRERFRTPELLQFERDDFMGELQALLAARPNALDEKRAEGEAHLGGGDGAESDAAPIPLYQPAHERYYLVTASLVCRERGLPDRGVDTTKGERVSFVLRRLEPAGPEAAGAVEVDGQPHVEYGWTRSEDGTRREWHPVSRPRQVMDGEERQSMFPQTYAPDTPQERMTGPRRLWAGLIPVAKREAFETAPLHDGEEESSGARVPADDPEVGDRYALDDPRKTYFETRILRAFKGIRDQLASAPSSVSAADARNALLFAWLDLWQFLTTHLPAVARAIERETPTGRADLGADARSKRAVLRRLVVQARAGAILRRVAEHAPDLEAGRLDGVSLPHFSDGGASLDRDALRAALDRLLAGNAPGEDLAQGRPRLQAEVNGALGTLGPSDPLPDDLRPPSTAPGEEGVYVVRCVYERPHCPPSRRTTVSAPSRPFRLASFFDAEAPARDINITLPGASVQDFRDSSQSVTMRFTKELRKQAQRIGDITFDKLQEGTVGPAPKVNIGMICSLSIPIITICALILLLVMVVVLNIVFWWLPFFKICFPLPTGDTD